MGEKKRVKISLEREGRESVYSAWKSVCERKKKEERKREGRRDGGEREYKKLYSTNQLTIVSSHISRAKSLKLQGATIGSAQFPPVL